MKYVFFGTPEFAAIILERLIDAGYPPAALVCNPDRPVGRKKIVTAPAAKEVIMRSPLHSEIAILQPEKPIEANERLKEIGADIFVIASYAKIIPKNVIEIPARGVIGIHPSLLPAYRGPAPIQAAILDGDAETGVTLYLVDEKIDHGPILASAAYSINERETYKDLEKNLAQLGAELFVKTIPSYLRGDIVAKPQQEAAATYTKKFTTDNGFIAPEELQRAFQDLNESKIIFRKIRALNPEPGTWTIISSARGEKRLKLLAAEMKDGLFELTNVQLEGNVPTKDPREIQGYLVSLSEGGA